MAQQQQQRTISQTKEAQLKSYQKRLKDDMKGMVDNFMEIMKLVKVHSKCKLHYFHWLYHKKNLGIRLLASKSSDPINWCTNLLEVLYFHNPQVDDENQVSRPTKSEQDQLEMEVRASNIVRQILPNC